jgi:hypothetical protein
MSSELPPGNGASASGQEALARPIEDSEPKLTQTDSVASPESTPRLAHLRLLAERESEGLLSWFQCSKCGREALDPIGFDGPHQALCENCADPELPRE